MGLKFIKFSVISQEECQLHKIATDRSRCINLHSNLLINIQLSDILGDRSSPEIFFLRWVTDPGVQTDNVVSPATQCTEATNKTRRLINMIRRSFQDLSKSAFVPFHGAFVRPHLENGTPAYSPNLVAGINHQDRIQISATRLVTGMRHLPYEERLQRLGLHSLEWRRLRDELITAFKIFKGHFGY